MCLVPTYHLPRMRTDETQMAVSPLPCFVRARGLFRDIRVSSVPIRGFFPKPVSHRCTSVPHVSIAGCIPPLHGINIPDILVQTWFTIMCEPNHRTRDMPPPVGIDSFNAQPQAPA